MFDKAAHGNHIGNAGHLTQGTFNDPVFQRAQIGHGLAIAAHAVAHDFANRGGIGRHVNLRAGRYVHVVESLVNLLANDIYIGRIVIRDNGIRQAKLGVRENSDRVGQA